MINSQALANLPPDADLPPDAAWDFVIRI